VLWNNELDNNEDTLEILVVLGNPQHIVFVVDEEWIVYVDVELQYFYVTMLAMKVTKY
jgi:hypothetical protein